MTNIKQEQEEKIKTEYRSGEFDKHKQEVNHLIGYAVKEGFIGDEVEGWTEKEKEDYFNACMAFEPTEEE